MIHRVGLGDVELCGGCRAFWGPGSDGLATTLQLAVFSGGLGRVLASASMEICASFDADIGAMLMGFICTMAGGRVVYALHPTSVSQSLMRTDSRRLRASS